MNRFVVVCKYIMHIPFYFIENSWCFLEIHIKNNSYWIDWNVIYDENHIEIKYISEITLDFKNNSNILCIKDNKKLYDFNHDYNLISVDGSCSLDTLSNLKNIYDEFLYIDQK